MSDDSKSRRRKSDAVMDFLRSEIRGGRLRPGDRLPSERELASRTRVSRPTVRAAFSALAVLGIVDVRHGSGTFLADGVHEMESRPLKLLSSLHGLSESQILDARRALEVAAAGLAAVEATPEQLATIADEVTAMFASVDDVERFREHDVRFHQHLARASGNPMLAAFVDMVAGFSVGRRSRSSRGDDLRAKATHHRNIYLAVRARNADLARTAMNQHLPSPSERIPAARAV